VNGATSRYADQVRSDGAASGARRGLAPQLRRTTRLTGTTTCRAAEGPTFLLLAIFNYYPFFSAFYTSFTQSDGINPPIWVGLQNFQQLFADQTFLHSFVNIVILTAAGIVQAIVPALIVAAVIFHLWSERWRYFYRVHGRFIDLLDSTLPLVETRAVAPGEQVWLRAIDAVPAAVPQFLASAARVRNQDSTEGHVSFMSECLLGVRVRTALRVATRPTRVRIDGQAIDRYECDERVGVLWLQHDGKPSGTVVQIEY
jgi:hypothetical protein